MSLLLTNIHLLAGIETNKTTQPLKGDALAKINQIENAFVLIENERIADFGPMDQVPDRAAQIIDCTGKTVLPTWCDSHTHLVFAGSRESEFEDRIKGLSYQEIARRGGGILNSANRLRKATEEELFDAAQRRLEEVTGYGTGLIEIKSGYGLSVESELKMLRIVRRLKETSSVGIKASFLGAHALPNEYKDNRQGYIDLVVQEMLPNIAAEGLADYVDVFCEKVAFSIKETDQILEAAAKYGLRPKIHTNQFNSMGGIETAIRHDAISVDHLEVVNESEIEALQASDTIATLLPSAPFFLSDPYPPARDLIHANIPVALATDFNPGSTPSGRMSFVLSLACLKMKMLPSEAINAATINGAFALESQSDYGSITKGKYANLIITKPIPSLAYIPYAFGSNVVEKVVLKGKV